MRLGFLSDRALKNGALAVTLLFLSACTQKDCAIPGLSGAGGVDNSVIAAKNLANSSARSNEELQIVDYGPKSAIANHGFNEQPNGESAAWFKLNRSVDGSEVYVHFGALRIRGAISGNIVTVHVADSIHDKAGDTVVYIEEIRGRRATQSNAVHMVWIER
jgi:hypothetical protein